MVPRNKLNKPKAVAKVVLVHVLKYTRYMYSEASRRAKQHASRTSAKRSIIFKREIVSQPTYSVVCLPSDNMSTGRKNGLM